jgi:hypothetical protein
MKQGEQPERHIEEPQVLTSWEKEELRNSRIELLKQTQFIYTHQFSSNEEGSETVEVTSQWEELSDAKLTDKYNR